MGIKPFRKCAEGWGNVKINQSHCDASTIYPLQELGHQRIKC